jgi:hypothetical protein
MTADGAGWGVKRMKGGSGTVSHPFIATNPTCPQGRHPTRVCGCKVFRTEREAQVYAAERNRGAP